jgi:F-type H+-transporting ATPase subunit epsilon
MLYELTLNIVSINGPVFEGPIKFVKFIGPLGEIGILVNHAPLLTRLMAGPIVYEGVEENGTYYVSGGIVEVKHNLVNILADSCFRTEDLDHALILQSQLKAELLTKENENKQSFHHAYGELIKSTALLRCLELYKKRKE